MNFLIWSGSFLLISIGGSAIELAGMIGLPIAPDIHIGVMAFVTFLIASGILMATRTAATVEQSPVEG